MPKLTKKSHRYRFFPHLHLRCPYYWNGPSLNPLGFLSVTFKRSALPFIDFGTLFSHPFRAHFSGEKYSKLSRFFLDLGLDLWSRTIRFWTINNLEEYSELVNAPGPYSKSTLLQEHIANMLQEQGAFQIMVLEHIWLRQFFQVIDGVNHMQVLLTSKFESNFEFKKWTALLSKKKRKRYRRPSTIGGSWFHKGILWGLRKMTLMPQSVTINLTKVKITFNNLNPKWLKHVEVQCNFKFWNKIYFDRKFQTNLSTQNHENNFKD